jgi:hypothetical protein
MKCERTGSAHWASSLATTNNKISYLIYNNSIESAIKTYNMSVQWIALELWNDVLCLMFYLTKEMKWFK